MQWFWETFTTRFDYHAHPLEGIKIIEQMSFDSNRIAIINLIIDRDCQSKLHTVLEKGFLILKENIQDLINI